MIRYECPNCPAYFPFFWQFAAHTSEGCEMAKTRAEFEQIVANL